MGIFLLILFLAFTAYAIRRVYNFWKPEKKYPEILITPKPKKIEVLPDVIEPETFEAPREPKIVMNNTFNVVVINVPGPRD